MSITFAPSTGDCSPTLGELMCEHRTSQRESMRAVSRRCELAPADIAQVELGRADLGHEALAAVVRAYAVPRTRFPVNRSEVLVDVLTGAVAVRPSQRSVDESSTDAVLLVYLELLYAKRDLDAGIEVTITSLDLDLVRLMLSTRTAEVEARIGGLVLPVRPVALKRRRSNLATFFVGAGAMTATLAVLFALGSARTSINRVETRSPNLPIALVEGTVVVRPEPTLPIVVAPIEVEIIDPLVLTRQPDGRTTSTDAPAPTEPSKENK